MINYLKLHKILFLGLLLAIVGCFSMCIALQFNLGILIYISLLLLVGSDMLTAIGWINNC